MAENVYRCDGTYQQQPCGESEPLAVRDPRTPEQQQQARQTTQRQAAAARALERERLQAQKAQAPHGRKAKAQQKTRTATKKQKAPKEPPYFTAQTPVAPATAKPTTP
ncbi:MAG: hypothetical protein ACT4NV_16465 [Rhodoferax sp.]